MPEDNHGWGKGFGYGLEIAVGIGLGVAVGMWWDRHHNSAPWGLLVGLFVGGTAGTYLLIKDVSRMK